MGLLIEQYAGAFPFWVAPVQAVLIPIADRHHAYAEEIKAKLSEAGLRAEVDARNEKMGKRIREAEVQKVPAMLVLGDRDVENRTVSLRRHGQGDLGAMSLESAITLFKEWQEEIPEPMGA